MRTSKLEASSGSKASSRRSCRPASRADGAGGTVAVAGMAISHPERVIYPRLGVTKLDVARYYDSVAAAMVPHVVGRPLTLLMCRGPVDPAVEKGGCVMMRHGKAWGPSALRRVQIQELHKTGEYLVADDHEGLVALAQMGVLEIHTWNSRAETPYRHDRVVVDLDPGPEVGWPEVIGAAKLVRQILTGVKLRSWIKTTGGKGLHVVVPIAPAETAACLEFANAVAGVLIADDPKRFTLSNPKAGRRRQILIDVLRNNRTNTSVSAYSLRARAEATVSIPVAWDELTPRLDPARFTIASVPSRLGRDGEPWADYWSARQALPSSGASAAGQRREVRGRPRAPT